MNLLCQKVCFQNPFVVCIVRISDRYLSRKEPVRGVSPGENGRPIQNGLLLSAGLTEEVLYLTKLLSKSKWKHLFQLLVTFFVILTWKCSIETVAASSSTFIPYFSFFFSSRPSRATRNCCVLLSSVLKVCQLVHQGEDHLSLSSSLDSLGETEWKLSGSSCIEKSTNSFPSRNNQLFRHLGSHYHVFSHDKVKRGFSQHALKPSCS